MMAQHNNVPYRLQVGRRGKTVNYHQAYDNRTLLGDAGRATGKAGQNIYPNRSHRLSNRIVLDGPSVRRSKLGQQDRVLPPNYIADYVRALLDEGATQVTVAYPERTHMREIGLQPNFVNMLFLGEPSYQGRLLTNEAERNSAQDLMFLMAAAADNATVITGDGLLDQLYSLGIALHQGEVDYRVGRALLWTICARTIRIDTTGQFGVRRPGLLGNLAFPTFDVPERHVEGFNPPGRKWQGDKPRLYRESELPTDFLASLARQRSSPSQASPAFLRFLQGLPNYDFGARPNIAQLQLEMQFLTDYHHGVIILLGPVVGGIPPGWPATTQRAWVFSLGEGFFEYPRMTNATRGTLITFAADFAQVRYEHALRAGPNLALDGNLPDRLRRHELFTFINNGAVQLRLLVDIAASGAVTSSLLQPIPITDGRGLLLPTNQGRVRVDVQWILAGQQIGPQSGEWQIRFVHR